MLRISVSWDRFGTFVPSLLEAVRTFLKPYQLIKIGFSQIKLIIGFQFYCYFEHSFIKCKSDVVLIVFTRWFYNRLLFDVWIIITIIPYTWRKWCTVKLVPESLLKRISWFPYPAFTLNQVKLMLIIRFKPIAYSWLLSKTIGFANLVI